MKFLSFDSSSKKLYVIAENDNIKSSIILEDGHDYGSKLPVIIKNILDYSDLEIKELDFIGISSGPGSLTGLRIGISLVKGLSYSNNVKILPFNSLDLFGYNRGNDKYIFRKGRKNYYYWKKNLLFSKTEYNSLKEIYELIPAHTEILLDDEKNSDDFNDYKIELCDKTSIKNFYEVMEEYHKRGYFTNAFEIKPLYLQKSIAEINWEKKLKGNQK
ncbi:MAG: tRNA threonylcarbamoyladenosine biosynthesis protein TsaB [Kosmotogales bacterium]|nr:tRNA threonylcarbamoyladenosine biosynthesis protein TsaB [Kosmotogales bacterium]